MAQFQSPQVQHALKQEQLFSTQTTTTRHVLHLLTTRTNQTYKRESDNQNISNTLLLANYLTRVDSFAI